MIEEYAEVLKQEAHTLGDHDLSERDFYDSGLFRGAIERIRGQFVASMTDKRNLVAHVLDYMKGHGFISDWISAGGSNRFDYAVTLLSGKMAAIELKGCLDGNNTNIFERPHNADEFIIWSICTNLGADPRHNVWSGIHTRLSAEIVSRQQQVDGVIVWDEVCGTHGRPCPKLLNGGQARQTSVGTHSLPPPCIYMFPATVPSARNNPVAIAQRITDIEILHAFNGCFGGAAEEINYVNFEVAHEGPETVRTTRVIRNDKLRKESEATPIRRS